MDPVTPIDGRFVPPTAQDFSTRAFRLSRLLDAPLQTAQETLSRLYGFASAHELRQVLKRPDRQTGPYDEALGDNGAQRRQVLATQLYERGHDQTRAFKRALVAELGLFATPNGHERGFANVQGALAYYLPEQAGSPCYARVGFSIQGEAILHRTKLGREVYEAMIEALDQADSAAVYREVKQLAEQHPGDPWAQADFLDEDLARLAIVDGFFPDHEVSQLRRRACALVAQFHGLYGEHEHLAIATSLIAPSPFGSDSDGYARALALSGKLAMAASDHGEAVRRFRRLLRMDQTPKRVPEASIRDPRGVRRFLDVALLNDGRPARRGRLKHQRRDSGEGACWRLVLDFAADALANDATAMRIALADIVRIHGRRMLARDLVCALHSAPEEQIQVPFVGLGHLHIDQFFLATAPVWRARPELTARLIKVLRDQAVARTDSAFLASTIELERRASTAQPRDADGRLADAIDRAWRRAENWPGRSATGQS